jgi:hypothetical protein
LPAEFESDEVALLTGDGVNRVVELDRLQDETMERGPDEGAPQVTMNATSNTLGVGFRRPVFASYGEHAGHLLRKDVKLIAAADAALALMNVSR